MERGRENCRLPLKHAQICSTQLPAAWQGGHFWEKEAIVRWFAFLPGSHVSS